MLTRTARRQSGSQQDGESSTASMPSAAAPRKMAPMLVAIDDTFQHRDAAGVSAQRLDAARLRTAHGAEHTPGQRVACQGLQHTAVRGVDGGVGAAGQHARGGA